MGKNTAKGGAESAVEERRLRPIYELLDINCNKKAVQELDRLLKKQPNFTSAKVLKALALLRLGKKSECEGIIATVVSDNVPTPTDENTIQALSICYREMDKPRLICELLEKACKLDKSEDLLTHSFMAHVRVEEFQKQHQIALSLYKLYPKTPYFSWSVMSLFVKAETESEDPTKLTLPLAERMMGKFIEDNKIDTDHELHLFLLILRKQGKYDKILELVEKSYSEKKLGSVTGFFQKIKIDCLKKTQKWEILAQYLEDLILENPDEWKFYDEYVRLFIRNESEADVKRVRNFLENILNSHASDSPVQIQKKRPALLACFLAFQVMLEKNISSDWDVLPLFKLYTENFGHKPTFFYEIATCLEALRTLTSKEILLQTMRTSSSELPTPPLPRDKSQRELNYIFLEQALQQEDVNDTVGTFELFETLVRKYFDTLDQKEGLHDFVIIGSMKLADSFWSFKESNVWNGFLKTHSHPRNSKNDEYSKIICNNETDHIGDSHKIPVPSTTPDGDNPGSEITNGLSSTTLNEQNVCTSVSDEDFPVLYCAAVLNYALSESPTNAQLRILLSKLFIRCGAVGAAFETLRGLDLKHIQLESLGYVYIWKMIHCGSMIDGCRLLHQVEHFFATYEKESTEHILSSYKYGSWEKILEFMDFRKLLLKSAQFATVRIERRLLEYHKDSFSREDSIGIAGKLKNELNLENVFLTHWNEMTDNRDLPVLTETGVRKCEGIKEWTEKTFQADKKKLKIRGYLLTLLSNCVFLADTSNTAEEGEILSRINDSRERLAEELASVDPSLEELDINSITGPWPTRVVQYAKSGHCEIFLKFSSLISSLMKEPGSSDTILAENSETLRKDLEDVVSERINSWKEFQRIQNLLGFSDILESGFDLVETLSFVCTFLDVLGFVLQRNANPNQNKSKKKKGKVTAVNTSHFSHFTNLLTITMKCLANVEDELKKSTSALLQTFSTINWNNLDDFWKENVDREVYSRVITHSMPTILFKLNHSYYNSLLEITTNIAGKTKYLESIRAQFKV